MDDSLGDGGHEYEIQPAVMYTSMVLGNSRWTKHDALLPLLDICLRQSSLAITSEMKVSDG